MHHNAHNPSTVEIKMHEVVRSAFSCHCLKEEVPSQRVQLLELMEKEVSILIRWRELYDNCSLARGGIKEVPLKLLSCFTR